MSDHPLTYYDTPKFISFMAIIAVMLGIGELIYGGLHLSTGLGSFTDSHYSFLYRGYLIEMPLWARLSLIFAGLFSVAGGYVLFKRRVVSLVPLAFALIAFAFFVLDAVFRDAFDEDTGNGIIFALSILGILILHIALFMLASRWMSRDLIR